jgi:catecholate siderophore receptor
MNASSFSRLSKPSSPFSSPRAVNALVACVAAHGLGVGAKAASATSDIQASENDRPTQLPAEVVEADRAPTVTNSAKFTEPVADIPQSIAVIPPEVYNAQAATTLTDALRNTPGITLFAGEGGGANRTGGDSSYLRGLDTSNSIFVDGVREEGALVHDLFDLAQVDVFNGPSPENGRGGTAGYINPESKVPQSTPLTDITSTHGFGAGGSRASDRETLDVNTPVASAVLPGTAAYFRLSRSRRQIFMGQGKLF